MAVPPAVSMSSQVKCIPTTMCNCVPEGPTPSSRRGISSRPGAKSHPVHARARLEHSWPAAVSNARGRGFVAAIDLATRELRTSVLQKLWSEEHVIAFACGERTLRLRPALSMTAEDAKAGPRR
jgi:L-lysine 6-transaminase